MLTDKERKELCEIAANGQISSMGTVELEQFVYDRLYDELLCLDDTKLIYMAYSVVRSKGNEYECRSCGLQEQEETNKSCCKQEDKTDIYGRKR
jgi:hypothetical protein